MLAQQRQQRQHLPGAQRRAEKAAPQALGRMLRALAHAHATVCGTAAPVRSGPGTTPLLPLSLDLADGATCGNSGSTGCASLPGR